ncbi:unnamed protein product [Owenia fusiformis]|uniref:Acyl-coenzyme A oxidase n=1 Tax=Owenia fusiformis TaxID=6347 RepID=A0A8J1XZQ3_OWEFU|nr:unnamed protein product [Owenia fusiformis]
MSQNIHPDLQKERNGSSFDKERLINIIDGGKDKTERRREIEKIVLDDPVYDHKSTAFMGRDELYTNSLRKAAHMSQKMQELNLLNPDDFMYYSNMAMPHESSPMALHTAMFLPTLLNQCSPEQQEKWLWKAVGHEIIGTYAQTEMGHGTHLRGLETTATYVPETDEFDLHNPTLTSTKWWPGNLGKTTNFCVLTAQLWIKGKCYGTHNFMLQTRSLEDHTSLPGITLGDIGPKFGYLSNDNGFMRLNHVRIPRTNMLMKHSQVLADGTYVKPASSKLSYGTMVFVRTMIVAETSRSLAETVTIATRYSAIRRQSEIKPGDPEPQILDYQTQQFKFDPEPQILDYQTQQFKLFPLLATSYAFDFAAKFMRAKYHELDAKIQQGLVEEMPQLHALSAGLKAFTTWASSSGMEVCRMSCGGHGYSQASGFPKIYTDATPGVTYEGENTVLMLQVARYLVKIFKGARKGTEEATGFVSYLGPNFSQGGRVAVQMTSASGVDINAMVAAYRSRAYRLIESACARVDALTKGGMEFVFAWNKTSVDLVKCATAHCHYFVVDNFLTGINSLECAPAIRKVLGNLCDLYACYGIAENSGDFLQGEHLSAKQISDVRAKMLDLLAVIRPDAVSLVDAFDFHDRLLGSVLGRYDGQVYENLYKYALESPLNDNDVHESYYKYLKPLARASKL